MSAEVIKGLKPEILWQRFYEISQVPRPSKKEEKIIKHLKNLAEDLNLKYKKDKVGNMVFYVPATKGYENAPAVVLQGHVDMVCEKNKGTKHDFENDSIELQKKDGWITAKGTTLGSDNGIGVAAALAVITDKEAVHGPLEILLTVDEETGLTGANNLEPGLITGKSLINMDSEEDGAFYVGCAGGIDTLAEFNIETEPLKSNAKTFELIITGLKGGHSGLDIHSGRGNAIKILGRILNLLGSKIKYSVSNFSGGSLRNAIPREAEAVIHLSPSDVQEAVKIINDFQQNVLNELKSADPGIKIEMKESSIDSKEVFSDALTQKLIRVLLALPNGVIAMSQDIPNLVETSTNVATIKTQNKKLIIGTSQRSSIETVKNYIQQSVTSTFELAGGSVNKGDGYPGWKPNLDSELLKISKTVFKDLFNKEPEIKAIHAGLECGILGNKYPGLDMISFGPTIEGAHSPDEKVNINTVEKFYDLLKSILIRLAEKN